MHIAIFLVYKHWSHIHDIQICQPRNKRSHCFNSQFGWHINNNGDITEKKSYSWSVGEIYTFEVIGIFLATFGPAQDVAKYSFTFRLQDLLK